jgi:four helix bundle protein
MARPKSYRELIVWQKAMRLAGQVYRLSSRLPKSEAFGLVSQMRRSAISVPSNIAEGFGRLTDSQFRHFLGNARGSLYELQTQIELAHDLKFVSEEDFDRVMEQGSEVARIVNGLITSLKGSTESTHRANSASSANNANSAQQGRAE